VRRPPVTKIVEDANHRLWGGGSGRVGRRRETTLATMERRLVVMGHSVLGAEDAVS
jgi:hypothetical protein